MRILGPANETGPHTTPERDYITEESYCHVAYPRRCDEGANSDTIKELISVRTLVFSDRPTFFGKKKMDRPPAFPDQNNTCPI